MILVDTSVWVDHLRRGDEGLMQLLIQGQVCTHPMVIGELACGNLQDRARLISLWQNLPTSVEASHEEAMSLLDSRRLMGLGIGFVDLHLLASTLLTTDTRLWTRDQRLASIAESIDIVYSLN